MVVRGQEVVLRCPSYSPAVKWARLEYKSYKIPEPATAIEPDDQVPSFLLSDEATPVDAVANAIRANKNQDGPGTILSRRDYAPENGEAGDDSKLEGIGLAGGVCVPVRRGAAGQRE